MSAQMALNFAEAFDAWYQGHRGYPPFPWQSALAERIAAGDWPEAITAPTGSGKTAIIDVWLWAQLSRHQVPRRLVYVIDRRLVVDGVSQYAAELAEHLPPSSRPLVTVMRGGITIDHDWLRDPLRPGIMISTVDQIGSRLLFSGYGVSPHAAPIHAGLLGNDCLYVLDEVHLAQPLLQTLRRVQVLRGDQLPLPWRILVMSATWNSQSTHGLTEADYAHPVLSQRLGSSKPAKLVKLRKDDDMAVALAREARALRKKDATVVAVVCNRVARARAVFDALSADGDAVLLTGRIRPCDKQALMETYLPRFAVGSRDGRKPLYVVATQTIEVGADLDVDALVTECAPLSALRQRAGRLNRVGALTTAPMAILYQPAKGDPVYGDEIDAGWKWLTAVASGKPKSVDFGLNAMQALMDQNPPPEEVAPDAPLLLSAHMDILSRTSIPHRMDVTPWLHGWESGAPDVYLCWRADWSEESVTAAPPSQQELLAIPRYAFQRWTADLADIEGEKPRNWRNERHQRVIRWNGERAETINSQDARTGDTLVLPCAAGGCDAFGWAPGSREPVSDRGDTERRVRLHPAVHPELAAKITALRADPDTTVVQWRELAATAGLPNPGRVLAYEDGCVVLAQSEWNSQSAVKLIPLADHQKAVAARAEHFAHHSGTGDALATTVRRAAAGHDIGKRDPRWQAMVGAEDGMLLAKGPGGDRSWLTLPRGWRHEMASAAEQRDPLVRHLIGAHHGRGRPTLPKAPDPSLWQQLSDWPEQFTALQQQFGYWGLAYLEALVRLADWTVSEDEQQ